MATSQGRNKGVRSGRIASPEPQSDWDSFSFIAGTPKDKRGIFPSPTEMTTSHGAEPGKKETAQERRIEEDFSPQYWIPRRRGRPRKNKEVVET
jgi:hypothetical protein